MAFSYGTQIAVTGNTAKAVEQFSVGDKVWAANNPDLTSWEEKTLGFSVGRAEKIMLIKIVYLDGNGQTSELIVNAQQPLLMPGKTLKLAEHLAIEDELVLHNGIATAIQSVEVSDYDTGLQSIGTLSEDADIMDGHLLLANGIVAGDHYLEINM